MNGIGVREVVAIGVLIVAGIIGFMFLDPTASEGGGRPAGTVSLGETPPTRVPPTATPLPDATPIDSPQRWRITYYDRFFSGGYGLVADGVREGGLVVDEAGAPFNDMRDDAWKVEASVLPILDAGRWGFKLRYDCELLVTVGGEEVASGQNPDRPETIEVTFVHGGGQAGIVISCEDTGGPLLLQWVD